MEKSLQIFKESCAKLGISDQVPEFADVTEKHRKAFQAKYMLTIICEAKRGDWKPDYTNWDQPKWYPYFEGISNDKDEFSGFRFYDSYCDRTLTRAGAGSRLCFENEADARWFGQELIDLHNEWLFINS